MPNVDSKGTTEKNAQLDMYDTSHEGRQLVVCIRPGF